MTVRFLLAALLVSVAAPAAFAQPGKVDFNRDVRPILSNKCFACHGPDEKVRKGDLRLDTRAGAIANAIVPGKPEAGSFVERITSKDADTAMPPAKFGKKLTAKEIEILTQWVKESAPYAVHWAYEKPVRPTPPLSREPAASAWVRNPVDAFILARLESEKLKPTIEADKYTLIRRVALDLTGLPPTPAEVEAYLKDESKDAYEKLVDRLLAKPAFGEHQARLWLDLARYADSAGYADDPARTIWKYRDYVIQSFNKNKPFDQFTIEQLAGDLLPNPTVEQLVATAFHRNTMTNSEGGTNDEEFRNVAIVDRVNTTYMVWMGTSMMCSQCHNHKYDPFSQKEYFQSFAIFNNTADADRNDESPVLPFFSAEQEAKKKSMAAQIAAWEPDLKSKSFWLRLRHAAMKKALAEMKPETTVPIFKELPAGQRRKTRLQFRGNFMDLGDEVSEGTPAALHKMQSPPVATGGPTRLDFAKWVMSPENPLTARVIANRFWEQLFGVGLVRTSEEFGAQGERPSHPEFLDWLATELASPPRERGESWDSKRFLKLLVTSATYRQSAKVTPELYERDPENRLLARGPRVRLSAEMVRDQALFVGGLLSPKMLGPSVRPVQPNLGVNAAFGGSIDWTPSVGEDKFRRGIYTQWRRSNPYPSMSTFDAPNRDTCIVRRARTNTPLQALVTMNDPVYVEAAQAFARRLIKDGGKTAEEKAAAAVKFALVRPATEAEVKRLVKLFDESKAKYAKEPAKAAQFATVPLGPLPAGMDATDAAAWTVVASVLLNLDEMFMKR